MSTTWNSTLICASEEQMRKVIEAANAILSFVFKSRLSIHAFSIPQRKDAFSLECSGFRSGHVSMQNWPPELSSSLPPDLLKSSMPWANLYLAQISSSIVGRSVWVRYSDVVGESAAVSFENGALVGAEWAIDSDSNGGFEEPFLAMVRSEVPGVTSIDDLFDILYGEENPSSYTIGG